MSYFKVASLNCNHYAEEWGRVLKQIKGWSGSRSISRDISLPLEAKALYVFTVARRLTRAAHWLNEQAGGWQPVFLEATALLFPMIELIGYSRVDEREVGRVFEGKSDVSAVNLWAGLYWLRDTSYLPEVRDRNQRADPTLLSRWQIGHIVSLRHYLLHGSKQASYRGTPVPIDDIISHELPGFVVTHAPEALSKYWQQLREDDGEQHWLERLTQADIRPLRIQGSDLFEEGLVDPDIVDYLEGNVTL